MPEHDTDRNQISVVLADTEGRPYRIACAEGATSGRAIQPILN